MKVCNAIFAAAVAATGLSTSAMAATITYSPVQNITADTDVSTTGSTVKAYTFASGNTTTVNGVTFAPFPSGTDSSTFTNGYNAYGTANPPYINLSQSYQNLLTGGYYTDSNAGGTTASITFNGLTVGQQYQVQEFVQDARGCCSGRTETIDGQLIAYNSTNTDGGTGQYLTGTFTADATSQVINFSDATTFTGDVQVNGLQLRAIPEPASLSLLGLGGLGLLARRRRA